MSIRELLDPTNSALIFIDHQPQMSFGVANIDRQTLKNNTVALAKAAKVFNIPTIISVDAHERSIDRMVQAGAVPVTWQQVLLEYQRDWSRKATYDAVMDLVREHSGAYGMGVDYAYTMVHGAPERKA